jgi:hypothetical protein
MKCTELLGFLLLRWHDLHPVSSKG